jgi:hypothetical protein
VGAALAAESQDKGRLPSAPGAAASLRVVGGASGDVPHVNHVEVGDVDAKLHGRRAEEGRQPALAESILALDSLGYAHLGRMLFPAKALQLGRPAGVQLCKEWIRVAVDLGVFSMMALAESDGIGGRSGPIAGPPAECAADDLDSIGFALVRDRPEEVASQGFDHPCDQRAHLSRGQIMASVPQPAELQVPRYSRLRPQADRLDTVGGISFGIREQRHRAAVKKLVCIEPPGIAQPLARAVPHALDLLLGQRLGANDQPAAQLVEDSFQDRTSPTTIDLSESGNVLP